MLHMGRFLGYDESVYVSQVYPGVPTIAFSAPRARGISWLISPVSLFGPPVVAIRYYLLVLLGVLLFIAFRAWVPILRMRAVAAAALFATGWITLYYSTIVMPNMPVAVGDIAAVGYLAQHLSPRLDDQARRRALVKAAVAVALVAVVRPTDATTVALGMTAVAVTRNWRLLVTRCAVLGGALIIGWLPWVIEAYLRYGGFVARMRAASAEVGGGFHPANLWHYLSLPVFGARGTSIPVLGYLSWLLLAIGLAFTIGQAARRRDRTPALVAASCGLATGVPYLLFALYLDARYLLPLFGLLAVSLFAALPALPVARLPRAGAYAAIALSFTAFAGWNFHAARVLDYQQNLADGVAASLGKAVREASPNGPCYFISQYGFPEISFASGCYGRTFNISQAVVRVPGAPPSATVYVLSVTSPAQLAIQPVPGTVRQLREWPVDWWLFAASPAAVRSAG